MKKRECVMPKCKGGGIAPEIGFGTYGLNPETMEQVIICAVMTGFCLFDTASEYKNEEILGNALHRCFRQGLVRREDIFIQSKFYPVSPYGAAEVRKQFMESLEKLRLDYLDGYLIHKPVPQHSELTYRKENKSVWKMFGQLKAEGKIRYAGVSNFCERHIDFLDAPEELPAVNQLEIHPYYQQKGLCEWCEEQGIAIQAWSPLARGTVLEDAFIRQLAAKYHKSPAQICLRWARMNGRIPITSAEDARWIKESFESMQFELEEQDMAAFQELNTDDRHWDLWLYKRRNMY